MHVLESGDEVYQYSIENKSDQLSPEHERNEQLIFNEFFRRLHENRVEKLPYPEFDRLIEPLKRYCVLGEIISAQGYQSDVLFCQYTIHIPPEWKTDPKKPNVMISGYSQMSKSTFIPDTNDTISYFGLPFELYLITDSEDPSPPTIYFKVMSVDTWDRQIVEGYGYSKLPVNAGTRAAQVKTAKPKLHFQSKLKSFFLGGCPDLQDLRFYEFDKDVVRNHYGFKTESSGSVNVRFNILCQTRYFLLTRSEISDEPQETERLETGRGPTGVFQLTLDALRRAKLRLKVLKSFRID